MGTEHEIARIEAYLTQADRRIAKHRRVMLVSSNPLTAATVRDLVYVLTVLRGNVKRRRLLQNDAVAAS